jgi:hypothetical protein
MSFILRFQTQIILSHAITNRPFGQSNAVLESGTRTVTEVRQESADNDPVTRRFETFPKATTR